MVKASLPPSPTIAFSALSTPVELDIERRIIADILALATLGARAEIARERFRQAQLRAAMETLRLAAAVRRAYFRAVAARQVADVLAEVNVGRRDRRRTCEASCRKRQHDQAR